MLEAFLRSIDRVLILIMLAGAGYATAARGWHDGPQASAIIAKLVTFLSLPAYLFSSVLERLDHDELLSLAGSMIAPTLSAFYVFLDIL